MITLKKVSKIYNKGTVEFRALDDVNLDVKKGDFLAITGKSGSGKSTLLNLIAGLDSADKGEISVGNINISNLNENKRAKWRGKNIGIVFQFFQLIPTLTALENILLAMDFVRVIPIYKRKEKALSLLKSLGIEKQAYKYPAIMSGGEQQRCAIARACANDPEIIMADEPTGNLDSQNSELIFNYFKELNNQGKTIITVTHDKDLANYANSQILLIDGHIEQGKKL